MEVLLTLLLFLGRAFLRVWTLIGDVAEIFWWPTHLDGSPMEHKSQRVYYWVVCGLLAFLGAVTCLFRLKTGHWPVV